MKIAAASDNGIMLTGHIGRCNMFLVYNIQDNRITNIERRENLNSKHEGKHEHHGEHLCCHDGDHGKTNGVHNQRHAEVLSKINDCKFVICNSAGKGMIDDLEQNKISVILTNETEAKKAVERFIAGELKNDPSIECIEHNN